MKTFNQQSLVGIPHENIKQINNFTNYKNTQHKRTISSNDTLHILSNKLLTKPNPFNPQNQAYVNSNNFIRVDQSCNSKKSFLSAYN